jgi:hypothetical protein
MKVAAVFATVAGAFMRQFAKTGVPAHPLDRRLNSA